MEIIRKSKENRSLRYQLCLIAFNRAHPVPDPFSHLCRLLPRSRAFLFAALSIDVRLNVHVSLTHACGTLSAAIPDSYGRKQFLLCFQAEVEVVEQYSDPRDSKNKAYVEPGAESSLPTLYTKVNRNYCRPYTGK